MTAVACPDSRRSWAGRLSRGRMPSSASSTRAMTHGRRRAADRRGDGSPLQPGHRVSGPRQRLLSPRRSRERSPAAGATPGHGTGKRVHLLHRATRRMLLGRDATRCRDGWRRPSPCWSGLRPSTARRTSRSSAVAGARLSRRGLSAGRADPRRRPAIGAAGARTSPVNGAARHRGLCAASPRRHRRPCAIPRRPRRPKTAMTSALALANELGMRPLVAHCHLGLGKLYRRTGEHVKAARAPDHRDDDVSRDGHARSGWRRPRRAGGAPLMRCPHCAFENRDGARFCEECGRGLERVCPACGAPCPPGRKFCGGCGQPLSSEPARREGAHPRRLHAQAPRREDPDLAGAPSKASASRSPCSSPT